MCSGHPTAPASTPARGYLLLGLCFLTLGHQASHISAPASVSPIIKSGLRFNNLYAVVLRWWSRILASWGYNTQFFHTPQTQAFQLYLEYMAYTKTSKAPCKSILPEAQLSPSLLISLAHLLSSPGVSTAEGPGVTVLTSLSSHVLSEMISNEYKPLPHWPIVRHTWNGTITFVHFPGTLNYAESWPRSTYSGCVQILAAPLTHLPAVWSWASHFTSLCLSFFFCKVGTVPTYPSACYEGEMSSYLYST